MYKGNPYETYFEMNKRKCSACDELKTCFSTHIVGVLVGTLSHPHLLLTLLCWLQPAVGSRILTSGEGLGKGSGLQFSSSPVSGVRCPV